MTPVACFICFGGVHDDLMYWSAIKSALGPGDGGVLLNPVQNNRLRLQTLTRPGPRSEKEMPNLNVGKEIQGQANWYLDY